MISRKIGLRLNIGRRIDQGMMTAIGQTEIDVMIIDEMIDMTMTDMMIIIGIIEIICQGTIKNNTRVTDIMMIEG